MKKHTKYLKSLDACGEAVEWAKNYDTLQKAWDDCHRGDWMLWLLGAKVGKPGTRSRKKLVLTACKCARLSLRYVPEGEMRPLKAIETAENYARDDDTTLDEVRTAAASAAAAYASSSAASSAAYAAYASSAAASKECADIVRKDYPKIKLIKP